MKCVEIYRSRWCIIDCSDYSVNVNQSRFTMLVLLSSVWRWKTNNETVTSCAYHRYIRFLDNPLFHISLSSKICKYVDSDNQMDNVSNNAVQNLVFLCNNLSWMSDDIYKIIVDSDGSTNETGSSKWASFYKWQSQLFSECVVQWKKHTHYLLIDYSTFTNSQTCLLCLHLPQVIDVYLMETIIPYFLV